MAGISHASAGSPVQDPNTCTFWDSILDIFYEADCGSQYVGLTVRQSSQPYWKTISGLDDGDYIVEFKEKNKQKSEICFWSKTATRVQDLPNKYSLYDEEGNEIVRLNRKQESGKYGYCRIVDTETYIKMNPTVVFQEDSTIQYLDVASGLEVNNTLKKYNGLNYVIAPNDIWIRQSGSDLKFGATDSVSTNDTQYMYELSSNNVIWRLEGTKWVVNKKGNNYQIVDFADVCRYQGCSYESFNNQTGLKVYFTGQYINNGTFSGIIIDPSYTVVPTSGNLYNQTRFESATNVHLSINDTGEKYLYVGGGTGASDHVQMPDEVRQQLAGIDNFTVSVWVNSKYYSAYNGYIGLGGSTRQIWLYEANNNSIIAQVYNSGGTSHTATIVDTIPVNEWHLYTIRLSSGNLSIWRDGIYKASSSFTGVTRDGSTSYGKQIGSISNGYASLNGSLDEAMFFTRPLSDAEIQNIYTLNRSNYNGSTESLVAYYNFDNGINDYKDSSGNYYDGTGVGNVYTKSYDSTQPSLKSDNIYQNLLAYYSFDADSSSVAYDLSNNNFDGTITNAINTSGIYGSGKDFDGTGDYITSTGLTSSSGSYTFSYWLKTNRTQGTNLAYLTDIQTGRLIIGYRANSVTDIGYFDGTWKALTPFTADDWTMVTFSLNSATNNGSLYINGVYNASSTFNGLNIGGNVVIGGHNGGASSWYNGSMDEVMIFATALNSTQIQAIYNNQSKRFKEDGTVTFKPISDGGSYNQVNFSNNFSSLLNTTEERRVGFWKITNGYNVSQGNVLNSLVAYWQGDRNANDYFGVYNGSLQADANVSEYGIYNNSFSFDGSGDFVNISDIDLSSAFTLETWVYLNSLPTTNNNYPLISKGTTNAPYVLDILNDASNRKYFRLFGYESATPKGITGSTNNYVVANQWYHVVGTFDGTSVWKIYVDGVLKDSTTSSATLTQSNENLYLGYRSSYLDGKLDDVRIWNKSLSLTEIQSLYNKGLVTNWTYSDWVQATNNQNSTIDSPDGGSYTTFSPEIRLNSNSTDGSSKFYTPYANSNLTIGLIFNPPTASFLSGTTNGSQAEGVQTIISNVSWNYASQVTTYLNYSNGTNYATITNTTSPAINIWTNVPFGDYILYAIASAGGTDANTGQNNITLSADLTNPFIEFISPTPANDTSHGGDNLLELYTNQTDVNPKNVTYYLFHDNGTLVDQHTLTWTTSPETLNWNFTIPISGTYYWYNATACDYYDNCNSTETRRVYVDFELAILDLLLPLWENLYESTYVPLSYFAYDPSGIAQVWYNVLYSSNGTNSTYISNTTISGNTTVAITDVGSYYLNLWANDTVGNVGSDLTFFDVTNVSVGPEGPQGPTGPTGPQGPQGEPGVNGTSVDLLSQICKYKKLGYYNEELPFLKEVNCV